MNLYSEPLFRPVLWMFDWLMIDWLIWHKHIVPSKNNPFGKHCHSHKLNLSSLLFSGPIATPTEGGCCGHLQIWLPFTSQKGAGVAILWKSGYSAETKKWPSGGRWYAPKCVTPGVSAWSHRYSINISINIKNVQQYILSSSLSSCIMYHVSCIMYHVSSYFIFVTFFTQPQFEAWKFYTWKRVNARQKLSHDKTA